MYDYYLLDGASGTSLWVAPCDHKAFATAGISDISGDGQDDLIAGSGYSVNRLRVLEGATGDTLWTRYTDDPIETVSPLKTIDWDASAEILVGTRGGEILCLAGGTVLTDIAEPEATDFAGSFRMQIYPNPFNPVTTIAFNIPDRGQVRLAVFDVNGRRVRELVDDVLTPGEHSVVWDGRNDTGVTSAPGVYFARLEAGSKVVTRKMVLAK
jgi:hypothetical protein